MGMTPRTWEVGTREKPTIIERSKLVKQKYRAWEEEDGSYHEELILGDEFTPDGCRVWDLETREKLDKDRFRQDLGDVVESYGIIANRLGIKIA